MIAGVVLGVIAWLVWVGIETRRQRRATGQLSESERRRCQCPACVLARTPRLEQ